MEVIKNIINGEEAPAVSGEAFENINPATEEVIAEVASSGAEDVNKAVESAQAAFDGGWGAMPAAARAAALKKFCAVLTEHAEDLAKTESLDVGKPIKFATYMDAPLTSMLFDYAAGICDKVRGTYYQVDDNYLCYTCHEPMGVAACIIPWNFPLLITAIKVAPALAAGNTVILKPSKDTPMSANLVGKLALEAGLPPGVLNVVQGPGRVTGQALAEHPDVPKISFTGSTQVGIQVMKTGAEQVKSMTMELGGKNPNIIFDDADLEAAVSGSLFTGFINSGQICTSGSRILVQESIAKEFTDALVAKAAELVVGPPSEMTTDQGPIITEEHYKEVLDFIALGEKECETIYKASLPEDLDKGFFVPVHIFGLQDTSCALFRREVFGPILTITTFKDEDEAVALANDSMYGLSASFWTKDFGRVNRMARAIKSGIIWGNTCHYVTPDAPYGGYKHSGVGVELGVEGLKDFMKTKTVYLNAGPDKMALK
ncbi:aldehyde dehydrogenase family protein [Candidatus Hydrogenedentota bacterium]